MGREEGYSSSVAPLEPMDQETTYLPDGQSETNVYLGDDFVSHGHSGQPKANKLGTFRHDHLDRQLERHHITSIAFSGTIGVGLFIYSGEIIGIGGSVGCLLGFSIAGFVVIGVMRSLAEMVSVRPLFSALIDYPYTFVDEALGFAVGVIYCLAQCISMATLTSAAAKIAENFDPDHPLEKPKIVGIILGLLAVTMLSNACGVRIYGNLERVVKWIKLIVLIAVSVLMIIINLGVGNFTTVTRTENYSQYPLPPSFNPVGFTNATMPDDESSRTGIPGASGRFLSVWTCITLAMFACMGGDIVIVTAGEAKFPRKDLPVAARFMYLVPISFYILASALVGLNVNYFTPGLSHPYANQNSTTTPSSSPFVITVLNTTLAPQSLSRVLDACFLFSAYTAGNTALFASSRTLFALARTFGNKYIRETIGHTTKGHTPMRAIFICSTFGFLAFLVFADITFNQPLLSLSAFFTSSIACVYASQCIAFLRFKGGLKHLEKLGGLSRDDEQYEKEHYRAHWQPMWALLGLAGSILIVLFSGWPTVYIISQRSSLTTGAQLKPNHLLAWDLVGAYSGPIIFLLLYAGYKLYHRTSIRSFSEMRDQYILPEFDENTDDVPERRPHGFVEWFWAVWGLIK